MPLCRFDDSYAMFGATPVENLFLEEFMPRAPGDCVKVYLYGLKLCQDGGKDMSLSAVSHQLKVLKDAKLVKGRRSGKQVYYSLCDEHIFMLLKTAEEHLREERE